MNKDADQQTSSKRPFRSWFRFSVRTGLVITTVIGIWFSVVSSSARRQARAVSALTKAGVKIVYDWQRVDSSSLQPEEPKSTWLRELLGPHYFDQVIEVSLRTRDLRMSDTEFGEIGHLLADLSALETLSLSHRGELTKEDCHLIGSLSRLKHLTCNWVELSEEGVREISRASQIRTIRLDEVVISSAAFAQLANLPMLEELHVSCRGNRYGPNGMVTEFGVASFKLKDEAVATITDFPRLRVLRAYKTDITDRGIESISRHPGIEKLTISSHQVTSQAMEHIAKMKQLKSLGTRGWRLSDDDLVVLEQMPAIEGLDLLGKGLTAAAVPRVAKLTQLTSLRMRGDDITDQHVPHLLNLPNLTWLNLRETSIDPSSMPAKQLRQALPGCSIILPPTKQVKARELLFRNARQTYRVDADAILKAEQEAWEALPKKDTAVVE